ncbi:MAG: hypothetical protein J6C17_01870 [Clostridia bacterium]|nr:hypothetical protein [Clostridia bacterium]
MEKAVIIWHKGKSIFRKIYIKYDYKNNHYVIELAKGYRDKRLCNVLKKWNIGYVATLEDIEVLAEVRIADGRELFYKYVPKAVKRFLALSGKELVRTAFLGKPTASLMIEMAEVSKTMTVYSKEDMESLFYEVYEETGLYPKKGEGNPKGDVIFYVDKKLVRIGRDFKITDVVAKENPYGISPSAYGELVGEEKPPGEFICGKNTLTI